MNRLQSAFPTAMDLEISTLIARLHETGQRLQVLTAGEVDAVADSEGHTFLLQEAQTHLRHREAEKQAAILNALPANIALVDSQGVIISVNDAWRSFASANAYLSPGAGIGVDYLAICDSARGDEERNSSLAAKGIRSVLAGGDTEFSIDYPCHSRHEKRWFRMTVVPLTSGQSVGAVVMHVDITEGKQAEIRIQRMNRGYVVLSQINTLIVRALDQDALFREACQIAVVAGGFPSAWIGRVAPDGTSIERVASAGADGERLPEMGSGISLAGDETQGLWPWAIAVRDGEPVIVNDLATDPRVCRHEIHVEDGVLSLVSLPLVVGGEVVAVFELHACDVDYFDEAELNLLRELAGDIAFAIDHIGKAEKLNYLAYYDPLTGLANTTLFLERAGQCLRGAATGGKVVAMVLVDLERFKSINDSLGQFSGDELLRQVATLLGAGLPDATLLGRVGSDRFVLLIAAEHGSGDVARQLETLIERFHENVFQLDGTAFRIAAKFGAAMFPEDAGDAESLFKKAESALKSAKSSGTRRTFYTQKMTESVARKLSMENRLRQALDKEEFVLHYQPKFALQSGRLTGVEALIRWSDPETGLVQPGQFIPVLEETGLIHAVGRWALRRAVDDFLRWQDAGMTAVRVAVNVSPLQLMSPGFVEEIGQLLALDYYASSGLELEITESVIMADIDQCIITLGTLRDMGICIAIDDFGTGFSSLGYLSRLPIDTLKIDRSFVTDMTRTPEGLALVSTIITLAHSLNLKVVAEGVETEQQSNLLKLLRCDEMQGFLYSKPLPREEFEAAYLLDDPWPDLDRTAPIPVLPEPVGLG